MSVNTRRWVEGDFRPICTDECEAKVLVSIFTSRDVLGVEELKLIKEALSGIQEESGGEESSD